MAKTKPAQPPPFVPLICKIFFPLSKFVRVNLKILSHCLPLMLGPQLTEAVNQSSTAMVKVADPHQELKTLQTRTISPTGGTVDIFLQTHCAPKPTKLGKFVLRYGTGAVTESNGYRTWVFEAFEAFEASSTFSVCACAWTNRTKAKSSK